MSYDPPGACLSAVVCLAAVSRALGRVVGPSESASGRAGALVSRRGLSVCLQPGPHFGALLRSSYPLLPAFCFTSPAFYSLLLMVPLGPGCKIGQAIWSQERASFLV